MDQGFRKTKSTIHSFRRLTKVADEKIMNVSQARARVKSANFFCTLRSKFILELDGIREIDIKVCETIVMACAVLTNFQRERADNNNAFIFLQQFFYETEIKSPVKLLRESPRFCRTLLLTTLKSDCFLLILILQMLSFFFHNYTDRLFFFSLIQTFFELSSRSSFFLPRG